MDRPALGNCLPPVRGFKAFLKHDLAIAIAELLVEPMRGRIRGQDADFDSRRSVRWACDSAAWMSWLPMPALRCGSSTTRSVM